MIRVGGRCVLGVHHSSGRGTAMVEVFLPRGKREIYMYTIVAIITIPVSLVSACSAMLARGWAN